MNIKFTASIDFNAEAAQRRLHLEPGGEVQKAIDEAVLRYSAPFIPYDAGRLYKSGWDSTRPGSGIVIWSEKYAHFQYVGRVRTTEDGRVFARKHESKPVLTDRPLKYTRDKAGADEGIPGGGIGRKATSEWIKPMKAAYMKNILDTAQKAMKGNGK